MTLNVKMRVCAFLAVLAVAKAIANPDAAALPGGIEPDGTKYETAYRCEGETLHITCRDDYKVKIIRANFGRFSIAICNKHVDLEMSVNCMAPSSTRVMKKKCDDRSKCSVTVGSEVFGEPCNGTTKYLEVHYGCVPRVTTTTVPPLPPWFLDGGGDTLWESRIPDPPEGFEAPKLPGSDSQGTDDLDEDESLERLDESPNDAGDRIPITTPSGDALSDALNRLVSSRGGSTSTLPTATSTRRSRVEELGDTMEYIPLSEDGKNGNSGGHVYSDSSNDLEVTDVEIVDIPSNDKDALTDHDYYYDDKDSVYPVPPTAEGDDLCPPTQARHLAWNWTATGETAVQPCPAGTTGLARWKCGQRTGNGQIVRWATRQPDMGDCKSLAMSQLESRVSDGDQESVLSASLAHLTRGGSNRRGSGSRLYGGDVEVSCGVARTLANRIQYLLQTKGDKFYNKAVYIQEVLLNLVRAASNLLAPVNMPAWHDLPADRQIKAANSLMQALEENAFLFADVIKSDEMLLERAQNIYLSVVVQEIGRMSNGTELPLPEYADSTSSNNLHNGRNRAVQDFESDRVRVPFSLMWNQAKGGVVKLLHLSYANLDRILGLAPIHRTTGESSTHPDKTSAVMTAANDSGAYVLGSRVVSVSFGRARQIEFPNTVEVVLKRHNADNQGEQDALAATSSDAHDEDSSLMSSSLPLCVSWRRDTMTWTSEDCRLVTSNVTHSVCRCQRLAPFALAVRQDSGLAGSAGSRHNADLDTDKVQSDSQGVSIVTLQIVTYIVAAISVVCVVLIILKFRKNLMRILSKVSWSEEKHMCNPRPGQSLAQTADKTMHQVIHGNLQQQQRHLAAGNGTGPEFFIQGQDGNLTVVPYPTNNNSSSMPQQQSGAIQQPVMVTLNPYSNQLVDSINRMMLKDGGNSVGGRPDSVSLHYGSNVGSEDADDLALGGSGSMTMNPQLARLTATLKKKKCSQVGSSSATLRSTPTVNIHENSLQMAEARLEATIRPQHQAGGTHHLERVQPGEVVFRAVSPHGHVYWEINPTGVNNEGIMSARDSALIASNSNDTTTTSNSSSSSSGSSGYSTHTATTMLGHHHNGVGISSVSSSRQVHPLMMMMQTSGQGGAMSSKSNEFAQQHQSEMQNASDFSDDDHRTSSEMSRQSSSRFSESRPLIYSSSSASTSPANSGHSSTSADAGHFVRGVSASVFSNPPAELHHPRASKLMSAGGGPSASSRTGSPASFRGFARGHNFDHNSFAGSAGVSAAHQPNFHEEVYAYAATDFSSGSSGIPEQLQSQVQIKDCRAVPVSVKSKEYIMAKIADYTERQMNKV